MDQPDLTDDRLQRIYSRQVAGRGAATPCVTPEAILAAVLREGPEAERLATLEHVMSCRDCHREYEWLSAVDQAALETEGRAGASSRKWWPGRVQLALAASLVAAVGTALLVARRVPDLDRGKGREIELVSPVEGAAAGGSLTFTWRALPGASGYVLEVQRQDGSIAFSDTTGDTSATIADPGEALPDSDYRWWVRETTDGSEPRSSPLRPLRFSGR
jgi:hypothetical protein